MSKIEWTEKTWNPIAGCTKVSPGCTNCYAEKMAKRLAAMGQKKYQGAIGENGLWNGQITVDHKALQEPLKRTKRTTYFVNSMSDLFHENVPYQAIKEIFIVMCYTPHHTYQVLTKRPERMLEVVKRLNSDIEWMFQNSIPRNVWLGVSVENQQTADERIPLLLQTPARVRFLSCEPLLGPVDLELEKPDNGEPMGLDWVIAGGESGPGARPMHPDWIRSLRDQCDTADVPFFFKQWGEWAPGEMIPDGHHYKTQQFFDGKWADCSDDWATEQDGGAVMYRAGKKKAGRELDGRTWDQFPEQREAMAEV